MDEIKNIQKKYCSLAMFLALVGAIVLIILDEKSVGKGLVLGTLFSVINFVLLGQLMPLYLSRNSRSKASAFAFISIIFRFTILAIPLIISLKVASIGFIGVVIGLFLVQITMLFDQLIVNRLQSMRKA